MACGAVSPTNQSTRNRLEFPVLIQQYSFDAINVKENFSVPEDGSGLVQVIDGLGLFVSQLEMNAAYQDHHEATDYTDCRTESRTN